MKYYPHNNSDWSYKVFDQETSASDFGGFEPIVNLWNSKRNQDQLPAWKDFELEEFSNWYGWFAVGDVTYDGIFDIHFRLWGTKVVDLLGYEMTGKSPRLNTKHPFEYDGGYDQEEFDFLETLTQSSAIGVAAGSIHWENRRHIRYEEISLPLADDGKTVDKILQVINTLPNDL